MTMTNPVWFITGASSGLGQALAEAVLERGWRAAITSRNSNALNALASKYGERALALQLDVTDNASIERAVSAA